MRKNGVFRQKYVVCTPTVDIAVWDATTLPATARYLHLEILLLLFIS